MRVNIGQGVTRPRVGIFRDRRQRKAQADGNEKDEEIEEEVWREMTEQDLEALTPEERQARKLQLGGQGAEAEPLEVRCYTWVVWLFCEEEEEKEKEPAD